MKNAAQSTMVLLIKIVVGAARIADDPDLRLLPNLLNSFGLDDVLGR